MFLAQRGDADAGNNCSGGSDADKVLSAGVRVGLDGLFRNGFLCRLLYFRGLLLNGSFLLGAELVGGEDIVSEREGIYERQ